VRICVVGWYFDDDFYSSLWRVNSPHAYKNVTYPVFVIAHRDDEFLHNCDLPYLLQENIGLEWGAYNQYLMKIWDGNESVLFMHDDIKLLPLVTDDGVVPGELVFNKLAEIKYDHVYIFQNRIEDVLNYGMHGRMVYFSERVLRLFKSQGGFLYDGMNKGYIGEGKKPDDVQPYNYGIHGNNEILKKFQEINPEWSLLKKVYFPSIEMGYRGKFEKEKDNAISEKLGKLFHREPIPGGINSWMKFGQIF